MEPLVHIFSTSLVKSTRLRLLIVRALLAMNSMFSRKRQRRKGERFYRLTITPSVSVSSYLNDAIPSLYVHLRSFKNAVTQFCGVYNVARYCYYSSPEVRFRQNDFRVYVSEPGCRANLRSACQFQRNYKEVYTTDIYLLESLTNS